MVFTSSLKGRYLFKKILKRGKYSSNENITVYVMKNNSENNYLGICVSKKHGNSVVRNRLKRWVREGYKELENDIFRGNNIIVLFKKNIDVKILNFFKVKEEMYNSMKELGVLK